jgi:hypothetical protein
LQWALKGKTRCRLHGGLSTGPRFPAGKAKQSAVEGYRRFLEWYRAEFPGKRFPCGRKTNPGLGRIKESKVVGGGWHGKGGKVVLPPGVTPPDLRVHKPRDLTAAEQAVALNRKKLLADAARARRQQRREMEAKTLRDRLAAEAACRVQAERDGLGAGGR